jgi:hypothetical protein
VDALGLTWSDLFPQDTNTSWKPWDGTEVDRYTYTDADGAVLFDVVRYEMRDTSHPACGQKEFMQQAYLPSHPDAGGYGRPDGYVNGRGKHDVDAVLYRLPEVIEQVEAGKAVFVVEGEKDVHTLEGAGFVATTPPQGAGQWKRSYTDVLEGAHVVILPDNDQPGRKHARSIAEALSETAQSVRVVELGDVPPKGDVTDWMGRGHTADELEKLAASQNEWQPSGGDGIASQPELTTQDVEKSKGVFWYVDEKAERLRIDRLALVDYLESAGFGKAYLEDELESTLIHVADESVVRRTSAERIRDHVKDRVSRLSDGSAPEGYTAADVRRTLLKGAHIYFSASVLKDLPEIDLQFKRDTADEAFFYFRNGFVEVTAESFTRHDYDDLDGHIWEEQIIDRAFQSMIGDRSVYDSDWHQFLSSITGGDNQRRRALDSAIGYLLHGYRDPAVSKAVVFMDQKDTDVANGRTGKSLVAKAIGEVTPSTRVDARNFSFDSRFAFQSVELGTRVVDFNDASKRFDFDRLFSCVTDDWQVERKGRDRVTISFDEAPKIIISTNYVLEGEGASFEDRVFQVEFAPHYTTDNRPIDEFGHRFFDEWTSKQWDAFYNLMLASVRAYLRDGLQDYDRVNVPVRRLKQNTCNDFAEWVLDFIDHNREYEKDALWRTFREAYEPDYDDLSKRRMGKWLASYSRIYNLELSESKRRVDKRRIRYVTFKE